AARARVGTDDHEAVLRRVLLRARLRLEVLLGARKPREPVEDGNATREGLRGAKHREAHRRLSRLRVVGVKLDRSVEALRLIEQRRRVHWKVTTERMLFPSCIRSNARLISLTGIVCVTISSILISPAMYLST